MKNLKITLCILFIQGLLWTAGAQCTGTQEAPVVNYQSYGYNMGSSFVVTTNLKPNQSSEYFKKESDGSIDLSRPIALGNSLHFHEINGWVFGTYLVSVFDSICSTTKTTEFEIKMYNPCPQPNNPLIHYDPSGYFIGERVVITIDQQYNTSTTTIKWDEVKPGSKSGSGVGTGLQFIIEDFQLKNVGSYSVNQNSLTPNCPVFGSTDFELKSKGIVSGINHSISKNNEIASNLFDLEDDKSEISIFNLQGVAVKTLNINTGNEDLKSLHNGIYIYHLKIEDVTTTVGKLYIED
jgi:hypothetical protein